MNDLKVRSKKIGGYCQKKPILIIETPGGLYIFSTINDKNEPVILATAPHIGIGKFLVEQKCNNIKWLSDELLIKSNSHFEKMADESFNLFFKIFLDPSISSADFVNSTHHKLYYYFYDGVVGISDLKNLKKFKQTKKLPHVTLVRPADFSEPLNFLMFLV